MFKILFTNFYKTSKIVMRTWKRFSKQFHRCPVVYQVKFEHKLFRYKWEYWNSFYRKQKFIPNLGRFCSCCNSIVRSPDVSKIFRKFFLQSCAVSRNGSGHCKKGILSFCKIYFCLEIFDHSQNPNK